MTTPYYSDDAVQLYTGEALAVLRDLPTASVDALVTDPPYSSGGFTRGDRTQDTKTKYMQSESGNRDHLVEFAGDNRDQRAYGYWSALWLAECLRIVKPGGLALIFTDWRQCLPGFYQASPPRDREHITQKPLDVMRDLVRIAPAGGTILDPFMGSGTTGVAVVLEGRRFVGVEKLEHFAAISEARIRAAVGRPAPDDVQQALDLGGTA